METGTKSSLTSINDMSYTFSFLLSVKSNYFSAFSIPALVIFRSSGPNLTKSAIVISVDSFILLNELIMSLMPAFTLTSVP